MYVCMYIVWLNSGYEWWMIQGFFGWMYPVVISYIAIIKESPSF